MKYLILALAFTFTLAPASASAQQAPPASADRAALEARLLALVPPLPLPVDAGSAETDTDFNTALAGMAERNPGKAAVIRPILTDARACTVNAITTAPVQVMRQSLPTLSDDDLRHWIAFYADPDVGKLWPLLMKDGELDKAGKAALDALGKKHPEQIMGWSAMMLAVPKAIDRSTRDCVAAMEKALAQAGIDTGETPSPPREARETAFVTAASPDLIDRFEIEAKGDTLLDVFRKTDRLSDANPDRKDAIDAIGEREIACKEKANGALAERLLPKLAADLPDATLDRMTAFYSGPDGAHYARLERLLDPTKADQAAFTALRKKYALDEFDTAYGMILSAARTWNPDPAWTAANQACDAATDQALAAAKLVRPPEPAEDKP